MLMRPDGWRKRTMLTYGCFDVFDMAAVDFLRKAAEMGDVLIVGCVSDDLAWQLGIDLRNSFADRRAMLEKCRYVDRVFAQHTLAQRQTDIVNYDVATLVMGPEAQGGCDGLHELCQVHQLSGKPGRCTRPPSWQYARNALAS